MTKDMTFPELDVYFNKSLENDAFWQRLVARDNAQIQNGVQFSSN